MSEQVSVTPSLDRRPEGGDVSRAEHVITG